jgi:hypothetical protein
VTKHYIRLIATVVFDLAVFSSPGAHQEPPKFEELEALVEEWGALHQRRSEF